MIVGMLVLNGRVLWANSTRLIQDTFPILIDTFYFKTIKKQQRELSITNADYLYIGPYKDTMVVNYDCELSKTGKDNKDQEDYCLDWIQNRPYLFWNQVAVEISIDTTHRIKSRGLLTESWETIYCEAFPVLLRNAGEDTIVIGLLLELPLLMEAKDSLGNWRPIEKELGVFCDMGLMGIILPPKEVVLTSVGIYHGNYETELRLKIGDNYSSPFRGTIHYEQFED